MSTNYLALRNSNLSTFSAVNFTYSSLTGSTITARTATYSTITLASSIVSLGQSTNQTYYGQTNGVYTTGWGSTLNTLTSNVKQVAMGSLGQYQVAVCGASTANSVYVTQNSGQTWSTLSAATGLPTAATTLYTSGSISATGQYGILATTGGYPYVTSSFGATYANVNPNTPYAHFKFENNVIDTMGNITLSAIGTTVYSQGIVGTKCLNLTSNPSGGAPVNMFTSSWSIPTSGFTLSGWFNASSFASTSTNSAIIFAAYGGNLLLTFDPSGIFVIRIPSGGGANTTTFSSPVLSLNTWYNFTLIFQPNNICYLYINNNIVATVTNSGGVGTNSSTSISLGSGNNVGYAFSGYIDDFKIYNTAIAFTPMVPMNYNLTAVSGNGQYMLASVSNGGLFMSSNFGSTWSQVQSVANQGVWTGLCLSHTGQYMLTNGGGGYVVPQLTGLTGATGTTSVTTTWTTNGVTWTSSASSSYNAVPLLQPWVAFNNVIPTSYPPNTSYGWISNTNYSSGTYNNTYYTTVSALGNLYGEWLQLQSSAPLVMYTYTFAGTGTSLPKNYYIVGSNNGTTWYPIHYCQMAGYPLGTTGWLPYTSYITVNYTGNQTVTSSVSSATGATTAYSTSTNAYTYFRLIVNNTFGEPFAEVTEWFINFVGGQSYSTNYGSSWTNTFNVPASNVLAISENGQYAIGANVQTAYIVNNYLAGFSTQSFTSPTLTSINATIVAAAISNTGQYMVLVTAGTSNNLYYSVNYGATFLSITLGSIALVSCSMSYDGSYITAASATTVYTLNSNGTGFSLAVGSSAGAANQAQNAIALGNSAGQTNQTANSIILNASGSALNSYSQGFYVAPIATALSCTSQSVALLGYGTDNQVVQSGITMANSQQVIYGEWIQLQLATGASITSYVLQSRNSAPARYPVSWTIVGSLDGVNWTILDTRSGQTGFGSYTLQSASPIYTYFRIIISQLNVANGICDIGGFILYNNGNSIFGPNANYLLTNASQPSLYNILFYNGIPVCTITWSWANGVTNALGITSDGTFGSSQPPGFLPTTNGNTININYFLGFSASAVGPNSEYNSSYIAIQGTSTIITNPLLQVADLSGNIKFQSSAQYPLDVNGVLRTQQLQFPDGSIQGTASNMQLNWGQFGQNFTTIRGPWVGASPTQNCGGVSTSSNGQYITVGANSTFGYIYVSSNYGQTWATAVTLSGTTTFNDISMSSSGQYQSITTNSTSIYISSTYGQTWSTITVSAIPNHISISGSGQYQIATSGSNVFLSTNYGQIWSNYTGLNLGTGNTSCSISGNGQYMIVAARNAYGGTGWVYTSNNYGQTWVYNSGLGASGDNIGQIAISYSGQYQTLASNAHLGTVFVSSNYGQSFTSVGVSGTNYFRGAAMSTSGQYQIVIAVGTYGYSTNYGQTWTMSGGTYQARIAISSSGQYAYATDGTAFLYTSVVPSYILGNVGIGATNPINLLSLQGTGGQTCAIAFNSSVNPVPYVGIGYDQTYDSLSFYTNTAFNYLSVTSMVMKRVTGYVGIGTTAPTCTLDVNGTARFNDITTSGIFNQTTITVNSTGNTEIIPNNASNAFYGNGRGVWQVTLNSVRGSAYCIIALNQEFYLATSMVINVTSYSASSVTLVGSGYGLYINVANSSFYGTYYVNIIKIG